MSLSPNGADVSVVGGGDVAISSSIETVDGPDGDGVKDTLSFAVQPDGEGTVDVRVSISTTVTWPTVEERRRLPVRVAYTDSARGEVSLLLVGRVAVVPKEAATITGTAADVTMDRAGTSTPTTTQTPWVPTGAALLAVVAAALARLRRRS